MPEAYDGPVLREMATFATWKSTFLSAAGDLCISEYYTVDEYENLFLSELMGQRKWTALRASAAAAEPALPHNSTPNECDQALRRRMRRLYCALKDEGRSINRRLVHFAKQFLRSAVAPALHCHFHECDSPYDMWQSLLATELTTDLPTLLRRVEAVTYRPGVDAPTFLRRLEAALHAYIAVALPQAPECSAVMSFRDTIVSRVKASFLRRALKVQTDVGTNFYELKTQLLRQTSSAPAVGCSYCKSPTHTDSRCFHLAVAHRQGIVRRDYDLPLGEVYPMGTNGLSEDPSHAFCTHCQASDHRDASCVRRASNTSDDLVGTGYRRQQSDLTEPKATPRGPTSGLALPGRSPQGQLKPPNRPRGDTGQTTRTPTALTSVAAGHCEYCHSKQHVDSVCAHLARAIRDGIVRADYSMPAGMAYPRVDQRDLIESMRRFCMYCQSTKHTDAVCYLLKQDIKHGRVRANYAPSFCY
ncbi:hypothetical protein ACHHYP_08946 [Achlya hypogyna]|uniref:Uncharacterized protein n=1 Tax=Achlya hypogyna TaxID=1202772 RepID=A0A1V9ZKF1_ACHHY|nr:hypothetical protein ACHHYP_08946 [Achlya hypogyna]